MAVRTRRVDAVVHLAAQAGVRPSMQNPALYADVNVTGTARMLAFVQERGITSVVFGASSPVYANSATVPFAESHEVDKPISPYAATKRGGEILCRTAHNLTSVSVVATRLLTVYGPRQRPDLAIRKFARLMAEGRPVPRYGDGTSARDDTFVGDLVDGLLSALAFSRTHRNVFEVVNLGSDNPITLNKLIQVLGNELGVEPKLQQLPAQPGDVDRTWADITRAWDVLGYDPQTTFGEGIQAFVTWMGSQGS